MSSAPPPPAAEAADGAAPATTAPPLATAVPSTDTIQAFLEDNDRLIKAVQQCFAAGRLDDAARYSERLHANLTWLAAVADAAPGAPPPGG